MVKRRKSRSWKRKATLARGSHRRAYKKSKRRHSASFLSKVKTKQPHPSLHTPIESSNCMGPTNPIEPIVTVSPTPLMTAESTSTQLTMMNEQLDLIYKKGYEEGYFEGGEAKVNKLLPQGFVLPAYTLDDILARGLQTVNHSLVALATPAQVYQRIQAALHARSPFSLIRLGDGELLTLSHNAVISAEEAKRRGEFLPYAGVHLPDAEASRMLLQGIKEADYVGIPESRHPSYQGLLFPVLNHFGLDYRSLKLTSSTINYALNEQGYLHSLLTQRSILLIGNQAAGLLPALARQHCHIAGVITPVNGTRDVASVVQQASQHKFDLAFVSAGIAAVGICTGIASQMGKVALDMGHLANKLESGETVLKFRLGV